MDRKTARRAGRPRRGLGVGLRPPVPTLFSHILTFSQSNLSHSHILTFSPIIVYRYSVKILIFLPNIDTQ